MGIQCSGIVNSALLEKLLWKIGQESKSNGKEFQFTRIVFLILVGALHSQILEILGLRLVSEVA